MRKCGPLRNQTKYISFERFWWELFKNVIFNWIWATVTKVMGIYVKFTMTTHQIWTCHVTLHSNSGNFYFSPNSILNFRKVTKFGRVGSRTRKLQAKTNWGMKKTPSPSAYRVKWWKWEYRVWSCETLNFNCYDVKPIPIYISKLTIPLKEVWLYFCNFLPWFFVHTKISSVYNIVIS